MTRKYLLSLCGMALAVSAVCPTAHAGWREFHYRSMLDFHRNNVWPQPFVQQDRLATCQMFELMRQNGWCQRSTLTEFYFHPTTNQLTEAGRMKVQEILVQHPQPFRTLFVVTGKDERTTAARIDSVQQLANLVVSDGSLPAIRRVHIPPRGWPAEDINAISVQYRNTIPPPRIKTQEGSVTTQLDDRSGT